MAEIELKAGGWEIWHDLNAKMMQPVAAWFCEAIQAAPGMTVLDVACGTGIPSLTVARRVGPNGKVVATDASPQMIGAARRKAKAAGVENVEHREMDGMALDFPDGSFDAVTCKDGLMFCPDPAKAVSEMRRVLKPGGRFAVTAWDEPAHCHFFMTIFGPVRQFTNAPPPNPESPGPFRLSAPGALERVLRAGGFTDFTLQKRDVFFEYDSVEQHFESTSAMATPLENAKTELPPAEFAKLRQAIVENLKPYMVGERVRVPNRSQQASGGR